MTSLMENILIDQMSGRDPGQITDFNHPLAHLKTSSEHLVQFEGPTDPYQVINWSFTKKTVTTILYGCITMGSSWASSAYSPAISSIDTQYDIGNEVGTLGISLFLFGIGLGTLLWAPISKLYGRKITVLLSYSVAVVLSFATAVSKDVQSIMITRFLLEHRAAAVTVYAVTLVSGAVIAPIVGGAVAVSHLDWRWTEYITGLLMALFLILGVIFLDECYPPALLVYKSQRLRTQTGNWGIHAQHEEWDASFSEMATKYLVRPFQLLLTPICFFVALYASFVYGILYLSLASFPIQFQEVRGWNQVRFYIKRFRANNNHPVPEARLLPMMVGSILFPAGMFILGWTGREDIFWFGPICGAVSMGLGFFTIFQAALNYLIDTFPKYSASAVAVNTFLRSIFAGCFPLFASAMFHNLGVAWASSVLGFIAIGLIPIPFIFHIFGPRIRAKGKWSRASISG
ncbi:hypothetical protein OIDMADRAFT_106069 [Oidiodendron maius Zn]|uniref:Major facilitator superfamily (MFS) profile domain-containing protein n=1 Tax=Oidiodendron maius (strain Zn) TaxID=913774 RepID=A0A0C3CAC1_OIDMZ|nr:hypothetical protein OIDMADRAFT_106069 [Oidiodendron maius Zn]